MRCYAITWDGNMARKKPALGGNGHQATPAQFAMDKVLWAAWLYYERRLKQDEVARQLNLSRASVFNLLQKARDEGVVTIAIDPARTGRIKLALNLQRRAGIRECFVLPASGADSPVAEEIGHLAARVLETRLSGNDTIGVAWGRTVLNLSRMLLPTRLPGISIVQTTGSALATFDFSPVMCTSNMAARLSARAVNLHAPGVVSSAKVKDVLLAEPAIRAHFNLLRQCGKLVFGVTQLVGPTLLTEAGFMSARELQNYIDRGAVGFASGYFFDMAGQIVRTEFDDRHITMAIEDLREVPERICIGGGLKKVDAMLGMLRAGLANILVLDEQTAQALLARLAAG